MSVTEVYGSTETGAVSQREQIKDSLWNPLKGISIKKIDKKLAISSPSAKDKGWYISEDLCEIHVNGSFSLKGRVDNIIKVGGKRISKTAIEEILNKHSLTEKAYVVFLKKRKNRVGAVVQLTREGNEELIDKGKVVLQKKLSKGLKEVIEKVAWPRYWRFVYEMPINQQGKITFSKLQELFDEESKLKFPDFLSQEFDESTQEYVMEFILPQNLFYFKGHFQGRPVLPGFVQISWAIHYAQELFGELGTFVRLEAIKFQQVIQPREKIKLKLRWEEEKHRLFFEYSNKNKATQTHHIFPRSFYLNICHYRENLIRITAGEHLEDAHPIGNRHKVDKQFQIKLLLAKLNSIKKSIEANEDFYDLKTFIFVLNTGFAIDLADDMNINDIKNFLKSR